VLLLVQAMTTKMTVKKTLSEGMLRLGHTHAEWLAGVLGLHHDTGYNDQE
jgi:hypothetical protein